MSDILKVENLCKSNILSNISFKVQSGEMVAIMGPSGSGKSTLLYNISGMDQPDSGKVYLADTELVSLTEDEKAKLRLSQIGFVFQQMNVLKNLTIIDNIMFPALHLHKQKSFKQALQQKALPATSHHVPVVMWHNPHHMLALESICYIRPFAILKWSLVN